MRLRIIVLLTALPMAVSVPAALGQESAEADESQLVTSLKEVVVTALRREQSLLQALALCILAAWDLVGLSRGRL